MNPEMFEKLLEEFAFVKLRFTVQCLCDGICNMFDRSIKSTLQWAEDFLKKKYAGQSYSDSMEYLEIRLKMELDRMLNDITGRMKNEVLRLPAFLKRNEEYFQHLSESHDEIMKLKNTNCSAVRDSEERIYRKLAQKACICERLQQELSVQLVQEKIMSSLTFHEVFTQEYKKCVDEKQIIPVCKFFANQLSNNLIDAIDYKCFDWFQMNPSSKYEWKSIQMNNTVRKHASN